MAPVNTTQRSFASDLIDLARAEGWTVTELPVAHEPTGCFDQATRKALGPMGADGGRNVPSKWVERTARVIELQAERDPNNVVGPHTVLLFLDAGNRFVRATSKAPHTSIEFGTPIGEVRRLIVDDGRTGAERRRQHRAESNARHAAERADRNAKTARADLWAGRLAEFDIGVEPFPADGRVLVDGERLFGLLSKLRNEAPELFEALAAGEL